MAVLLPRPLADEVDGLRRAVADPSLGRIPPHITLVPPVNVRRADLPAALRVLRRAAATRPGPLTLTVGSVATFMPVNPVLYLSVGGDLDDLRGLRDSVFHPPLERSLSWPWVPHVTLADGTEPERILPALETLSGYAALARIDRLVLLEEGRNRVWTPLADARLGPPARIGTGGLALELTTGSLVDPQLQAVIAALAGDSAEDVAGSHIAGSDRDTDGAAAASSLLPGGPADLAEAVVVTGHREGDPVGTAMARLDRSGPRLGVWVRPDARNQGVGGHLLSHLELELRRQGWEFPALGAVGPAGFYRSRSRWAVPGRPPVGRSRA